MKVIEIISSFLGLNGFTGLVSADRECGCEHGDLVPCDQDPSRCEAGYKVDCTPDCQHDPGYEEGNWHIQVEKPGGMK